MKVKKLENRNVDFAITILHVVGMLMIFLCHSMQAEKIYFLSEIFISGVPLFLFVSGFLAGKRDVNNAWHWWIGKAKRLILPASIFVITIYGIYEVTGLSRVSTFQWLFTLCNLQGLNYTYWKFNYFGAVPGCGHLWFITSLIFCYLLTPLMQKFKKISLKTWQELILIIVVLLVQLGLLFVGFQLSYIITFFFGYFLSNKKIRTDFLWFGFVTLLTILICGARLALKEFIDGSIFYDRYFALISAAFVAVWLFYAVHFFKEKVPKLFVVINCPALLFTERISYYFYLTHYIFLTGPIAVFGYVESRLLAHLVAFVLSYLSATVLYFVIEKGLFKIFERSKA